MDESETNQVVQALNDSAWADAIRGGDNPSHPSAKDGK
jgi:hypothetical protein